LLQPVAAAVFRKLFLGAAAGCFCVTAREVVLSNFAASGVDDDG
jgi:hypothetical protein